MLQIYSSEYIINKIILYYSIIGYVLAVLLLLFNNTNMLSTLAGFIFLIINSTLANRKIFKKSPFAIPICFFTMLFINIPMLYLFIQGDSYNFGIGVANVPFSQKEYYDSLTYGFLFLTVCWFSIWLGSVVCNKKNSYKNFRPRSLNFITPLILIIFAIFISALHFFINQVNIDNFLSLNVVGKTKIGVIYSLHAFLVLSGIIIYLKINYDNKSTNNKTVIYTWVAAIIFLLFLSYQYYTGGKGAILQIGLMFFMINIAMSSAIPKSKVVFLTRKFITLLIIISPLLFLIISFKRISIGSGLDFHFDNVFVHLEGVQYMDVFHLIMWRLSANGLDRYILLFNTFIIDSYSYITAIDYAVYASKNAMNLMLPGTVYPESYAPSGQLFSQVINKNVRGWFGGADHLLLLKSLNTSSYTAFGDSMILVGLFAPLFLFIVTSIWRFIYSRINNPIIHGAMIFLFTNALGSFGIDGVIGDSFNLLLYELISIYTYYMDIKIF